MRRIWFIIPAIILFITADAQLRLPRLISNGMVLQRDQPIKIWGWDAPGTTITVNFKGKSFPDKVTGDGKWLIRLPAQKAGGPFIIKIKGSSEIELNDILIGDVWLASGQSNMELWMDRVKYTYAKEIARVNYPKIRQFLVPDKYHFKEPQQDFSSGEWLIANKKNIGVFSAAAFFFAVELHEKYKVPIGIINSALGGSPAEAWISEESLKKFPIYYQEAQSFKDDSKIEAIEAYDRNTAEQWHARLKSSDLGYSSQWKDPSFNDMDWDSLQVPGYWSKPGESPVNGAFWFRKNFIAPATMKNQPAKLELGAIVDADSVFLNGKFVGSTGYQYPPRRYELPAGILKEGQNNLVIRVVSQSGRGGFVPERRYEISTATDTISLSGYWKYKNGATMPPLPPNTVIRWKPTGLYNAMIAPLINYPIRGVIWYQGESNTSRPNDYSELMKTLIGDWRQKWGRGNFPFLYVQLVNYMAPSPTPKESGWASLRYQQLKTLEAPNTGMAVGIDIGQWNELHPENKKEIGHRLALLARNISYGEKNLVSSGPLFQSMQRKGNQLILDFKNRGTGLMAKRDKEVHEFAIAGEDRKFVWAKAVIKGNQVIVWSDQVQNPVWVRYAWADNPDKANLYNKEGLPASPFEAELKK